MRAWPQPCCCCCRHVVYIADESLRCAFERCIDPLYGAARAKISAGQIACLLLLIACVVAQCLLGARVVCQVLGCSLYFYAVFALRSTSILCAQATAPGVFPPVMAPAPALPDGTASFLDTRVLSGAALRNRGVSASSDPPAGAPSQALRLVSGVTYASEQSCVSPTPYYTFTHLNMT